MREAGHWEHPMGTLFGDPLPGAPEMAHRGDTVTGVRTICLTNPDQPDVIFDKFTWKRYMMTFLPLLLFLLIAGIYAASGK